jgi:hypothetical protein
MDRLEMLDLQETEISDKGLTHLRELKSLRVVLLGGTAVTERGLAHLSRLPRLETISFQVDDYFGTGLRRHFILDVSPSDYGLPRWSPFIETGPEMPKITKNAALYLREMKSLRRIIFPFGVETEVLDHVQQQLPLCIIEPAPPTRPSPTPTPTPYLRLIG